MRMELKIEGRTMNRKSKHARLLGAGQGRAIVPLACSAVWLTTRVQRTGSLGDLLADTPQEGQGQTQPPARWRWSARYGWRQWAGAERPPSAMGGTV